MGTWMPDYYRYLPIPTFMNLFFQDLSRSDKKNLRKILIKHEQVSLLFPHMKFIYLSDEDEKRKT